MPTSVHISERINRPVQLVYEYVSNPLNLPAWASGLGNAVWREGDSWVADSPMGRITIAFTPENDLGVLDHVVTTPDGGEYYNPMRVIEWGEGSEIVFTLRQATGMSDADFAADRDTVARDLATLKVILE